MYCMQCGYELYMLDGVWVDDNNDECCYDGKTNMVKNGHSPTQYTSCLRLHY
jgi:hypothetical protein